MPGSEQDVAEDAVPVELEAALHRPHPLDPRPPEALVPAAARAQLVDVVEEELDGRPVAVADAEDERREVPPPRRLPRGEAGERGRPAVPVALRAHQPLADRGRARPPGSGRVGVVAEDGDLGRLEAAVAQRRVGDEPAEPGADDGDARCHGSYFTEPASRPWTKYRWNAKKTASGIASETNAAGAISSMFEPNWRSCVKIATVIGCVSRPNVSAREVFK